MAYGCPVCEEPQVDASHLANHLAFTAVIRSGDHEDWLDEHAPGWGENDEDTLTDRLLDLDEVAEIDHPIDASEGGPDEHTHDHGHRNPAVDSRASRGDAALDADAQRILDEAQELTRQMGAVDGEEDGDAGDAGQEDSEGETE